MAADDGDPTALPRYAFISTTLLVLLAAAVLCAWPVCSTAAGRATPLGALLAAQQAKLTRRQTVGPTTSSASRLVALSGETALVGAQRASVGGADWLAPGRNDLFAAAASGPSRRS